MTQHPAQHKSQHSAQSSAQTSTQHSAQDRTRPLDLIIVGAGDRGTVHARTALAARAGVRIVGVAEPREAHRERARTRFGVEAANVSADWRPLAARPRFADAVVIANPDAGHRAAAVAFAEAGYHILLEKPMATTAADCRAIVEAVERAGVILAVCHGLRYHPATTVLKQMLDEGLIGEVLSVQHTEPVGFWHYAHSFVRGNWRNAAESSPMLLAKSCHDVDWLRYVIGRPAVRVSSFGSLRYFRPEHKPAAAGDATRCVDCAISADCLYSAPRFYGRLRDEGRLGWPLSVVAADPADLDDALRDGPYGRCVYAGDNDVVDHQVLAIEYEGGLTASCTMVGTSEFGGRRTTVFGSHGELRSDQDTVSLVDFASGRTTTVPVGGGVHGGDAALLADFLDAVAAGDPAGLLTGPAETLETHLTVFAAETSRREGRVVTLAEELGRTSTAAGPGDQ